MAYGTKMFSKILYDAGWGLHVVALFVHHNPEMLDWSEILGISWTPPTRAPQTIPEPPFRFIAGHIILLNEATAIVGYCIHESAYKVCNSSLVGGICWSNTWMTRPKVLQNKASQCLWKLSLLHNTLWLPSVLPGRCVMNSHQITVYCVSWHLSVRISMNLFDHSRLGTPHMETLCSIMPLWNLLKALSSPIFGFILFWKSNMDDG